jgi:hypothetical protein
MQGDDMKTIYIDTPMQLLPIEEQNKLFELSRTNRVLNKDANGEYWQVLDCTENTEDTDDLLA